MPLPSAAQADGQFVQEKWFVKDEGEVKKWKSAEAAREKREQAVVGHQERKEERDIAHERRRLEEMQGQQRKRQELLKKFQENICTKRQISSNCEGVTVTLKKFLFVKPRTDHTRRSGRRNSPAGGS